MKKVLNFRINWETRFTVYVIVSDLDLRTPKYRVSLKDGDKNVRGHYIQARIDLSQGPGPG